MVTLNPHLHFIEAMFQDGTSMKWRFSDSNKDIVGLCLILKKQAVRTDNKLTVFDAGRILSAALKLTNRDPHEMSVLWNTYCCNEGCL
jgi:hypothetical protein